MIWEEAMSTDSLQNHMQLVEQDQTGKPIVAFFDLDRTLIAGYSIVGIARERIRHGFSRGNIRESATLMSDLIREQRSLEKGLKGPGYHRLVKRLSRSLRGISEETLTRLGQDAYENTLARSLYSEAVALVEAHRAAGHQLVIVTAATRYQVDPIAKVLGIDEVCCTGLEVKDGKFTGGTLAPLCYGEGKTMSAQRVCKRIGASLQQSWFYSDSIDDLPLLRKVGKPVAISNSRYAQPRKRNAHPFHHAGRSNNHSLVRRKRVARIEQSGKRQPHNTDDWRNRR
jgi:putative phosphoserine phosphatase/1-acylglycerol-3-phosphate O-acyltransferase